MNDIYQAYRHEYKYQKVLLLHMAGLVDTGRKSKIIGLVGFYLRQKKIDKRMKIYYCS
jgi:hypothetical protein